MSIKVGGKVYKITDHANRRMQRRGVTKEDVVEALTNIKTKRVQFKREGDLETRTLITGRNDVSLVVTDTNVIVTVYNYKRQYYANKTKNNFNKKRRKLKKLYGNRLKKT